MKVTIERWKFVLARKQNLTNQHIFLLIVRQNNVLFYNLINKEKNVLRRKHKHP